MDGRLPNSAHTSLPWRVHELTRDFRLEDVWALPTPGGPDDLPRLAGMMAAGRSTHDGARAARALWVLRQWLGRLLGLDRKDPRQATVRDRLPADLRAAPRGPEFETLPFTPVYLLDDEWAAEIANRTMQGVLHVGWVRGQGGDYHGQLAIYVKPHGLLGEAYMAAIKPFRHLVVYPSLLRALGAAWRAPARVQAPTTG